jgi:uncharacterized protein (UPF0147 family)
MQGLNDPNWQIRFNALKQIKLTNDIVSLVSDIALSDESEQVRALACSKLSEIDSAKLHSEICEFLAKIVATASSPAKVRKSAYWALERLNPSSEDKQVDSPDPSLIEKIRIAKMIVSRINRTVSFVFPDDVDWDFVNSFLEDNGNRTKRST